jgi:hypothetical protein
MADRVGGEGENKAGKGKGPASIAGHIAFL